MEVGPSIFVVGHRPANAICEHAEGFNHSGVLPASVPRFAVVAGFADIFVSSVRRTVRTADDLRIAYVSLDEFVDVDARD